MELNIGDTFMNSQNSFCTIMKVSKKYISLKHKSGIFDHRRTQVEDYFKTNKYTDYRPIKNIPFIGTKIRLRTRVSSDIKRMISVINSLGFRTSDGVELSYEYDKEVYGLFFSIEQGLKTVKILNHREDYNDCTVRRITLMNFKSFYSDYINNLNNNKNEKRNEITGHNVEQRDGSTSRSPIKAKSKKGTITSGNRLVGNPIKNCRIRGKSRQGSIGGRAISI